MYQKQNITSALSELNLEKFEYCELLKDCNITQVHIPKLIPLVPKNIPKTPVFENIPQNMLANSPECKVTLTPRAEVMNYIRVTPFADAPYLGSARKGDKLLCYIAHGPRNIHITNFLER